MRLVRLMIVTGLVTLQVGMATGVNLESKEETLVTANYGATDLSQVPWYQKTKLSGEVAFAYVRTGKSGARPNGSFMNHSVILKLDTQVTSNVNTFIELYPLAKWAFNVGETYINFNYLLGHDAYKVGMKVGRFDTPYGEEYLKRYWFDNNLIAESAAFPWGWEHGVEFYGGTDRLGWILGVSDNKLAEKQPFDSSTSPATRDGAKEFNTFGKIKSQITENLYTSVSFINAGKTSGSAFWFGNNASFIKTSDSTAPIEDVSFKGEELDVSYTLSNFDVLLNYGQMQVKGAEGTFDRKMNYYSVHPTFNVTDNWYVSGRYSQLKADDGFLMGSENRGGTYTGLTANFNTKSYTLSTMGLGYRPNPSTNIVFDYTKAEAKSIAEADLTDNKRNQWGVKFATTF